MSEISSASEIHPSRTEKKHTGMPAAYENQALARLLSYMYRPLCFVLYFLQSA